MGVYRYWPLRSGERRDGVLDMIYRMGGIWWRRPNYPTCPTCPSCPVPQPFLLLFAPRSPPLGTTCPGCLATGYAFRRFSFFGRGLSAGTDYAIIASRFCGMGVFQMNEIEPCGGAFEHAAHACAQSAAGRVLARPVAPRHPSPYVKSTAWRASARRLARLLAGSRDIGVWGAIPERTWNASFEIMSVYWVHCARREIMYEQ